MSENNKQKQILRKEIEECIKKRYMEHLNIILEINTMGIYQDIIDHDINHEVLAEYFDPKEIIDLMFENTWKLKEELLQAIQDGRIEINEKVRV